MSFNIIIVDYGLGNIFSVQKSFEQTMSNHNIEGSVKVTSNYKELRDASHIILPGQGSFEFCIKGLLGLGGAVDELKTQILINKKPMLGICVGMQLLANKSFENGIHSGLGWIDGDIIMLPSEKQILPHMGWNEVRSNVRHKAIKEIINEHFYFVHSYYFRAKKKETIIATAKYGINFPAIVAKENILGVQFHPEKSSTAGKKLILGFLLNS